MRRCKGPSHLGPGEHRGNVGVTLFILVKPKTVSLHRDVTLKSTTRFSYGGFFRITAPQHSVIPEDSIFFPSGTQKRDPAEDGANISTADGCKDSQRIINTAAHYR